MVRTPVVAAAALLFAASGTVSAQEHAAHHAAPKAVETHRMLWMQATRSVTRAAEQMPEADRTLALVVDPRGLARQELGQRRLDAGEEPAVDRDADQRREDALRRALDVVGAEVGAVSPEVFGLMLTSAAASIVIAPYLLKAAHPAAFALERRLPVHEEPEDIEQPTGEDLQDHAVICGYGGVGRVLHMALTRNNVKCLVIDRDGPLVRELREQGVLALQGNAWTTSASTSAAFWPAAV